MTRTEYKMNLLPVYTYEHIYIIRKITYLYST